LCLNFANLLKNFYRIERSLLGYKIVVKSITTDSTSKNFLLLGSAVPDHDIPGDGSSNYRHFTFKLDFSELFNRDCNPNDFEDWIAKRSGSDCFMGKKVKFEICLE